MQVAGDAEYWKQVAEKKELEIQSIKMGEQFKLNIDNIDAMSDYNEADEKSFDDKGYNKIQEQINKKEKGIMLSSRTMIAESPTKGENLFDQMKDDIIPLDPEESYTSKIDNVFDGSNSNEG